MSSIVAGSIVMLGAFVEHGKEIEKAGLARVIEVLNCGEMALVRRYDRTNVNDNGLREWPLAEMSL